MLNQLRTKWIEALNRLTFSSRRAQLKIYGDPNVFPDCAQSLRKTADGNSAVEFAGRFEIAELPRF